MSTTVTIGRFATMTHLSVKTLHHYHQVGLLEPVRVDADSGYRYYALDQLPTAQLIRRLRELRMPIPDVKALLGAGDPDRRDALLAAHLYRLEKELARTHSAVAALRSLLGGGHDPAPVTRRVEPACTALGIAGTIAPDEILTWWNAARGELRLLVRENGLRRTGPLGGLFDESLYRREPGAAVPFVPVERPPASLGRARALLVPAAELVVTTHYGVPEAIDLAHADLGSFIARNEIAVDTQIREYYLHDESDTPVPEHWQTEIAWSILAN
jgi:DNA-binding transcriptional MerR regulator